MSRETYDMPSTCPSCGNRWSGAGSNQVEKKDNDGDLSGYIYYTLCKHCNHQVKREEVWYYSDS